MILKNYLKTLIARVLLFSAAVLFLLSPTFAETALAGNKTTIYFFWGNGCPHCAKEEIFLNQMRLKYPQLEVRAFEVWFSPENARFFSELAGAYGLKPKGVPMTFIGDFEPISGYREEVTGKVIEERIISCIEKGCTDPLDKLKKKIDDKKAAEEQKPDAPSVKEPAEELTEKERVRRQPEQAPVKRKDVQGGEAAKREPPAPVKEEKQSPKEKVVPKEDTHRPEPLPKSTVEQRPVDDAEKTVYLPFAGEIDVSRLTLPLLTFVLAGLDGFNPCAFFVLFMLLSILVYARSRKRMLLIGGTFVFFSGFIYFLFMSAWLNIFLHIGELKVITTIAGLIAVIIALINIKDFFFFKKGVSLTIPEKAKPKLFERIRNLLKATSLTSMMVGTVVLAVVANTYEMLCTVGFPMVFTRVLTLHNLPAAHYYLYLVAYNTIYVIPLAVIVLIFSITLGAKKLTEWQGQVLKLISGLMMLSLGLVLLVNPALLNNVLVSVGLVAGALSAAGVIIFVVKRKRRTG